MPPRTDTRTAIAVHHTDTSTQSWDGPANEARLKNDGDEAYYRGEFAWQDPEKDAETKSAYKGVHHEVDGDGNVGDANVNACRSGIEALNGGRGGFDIPEADRRAVYNHFAAHLKDAGVDAPELKSYLENVSFERRVHPLAELRVDQPTDGKAAQIDGYAAIFNSPSEPLSDGWGFSWIETIRGGAFTNTLKNADVRALVNHNPDYVLGRNKAGTLTLEQDARGLHMAVTPPDTQWARDFLTSMERGDVNQMSFAFQVVRDRWPEDHEAGQLFRELLEVKLYDVSVVTYPAYPTTSAGVVRSLLADAGFDLERVASAVLRSRAGLPPANEDHASVAEAIEALRSQLPTAPAQSHSVKLLRRQLELIALG